MDPGLLALAQECGQPVEVATIAAVASVESGLNPFVIRMNSVGKNGMPRQPLTAAEAEMRASALIAAGHDLDLGLMGISAQAFNGKFGQAFDACSSIRVFVKIYEPARLEALKKGGSEKNAERIALDSFFGRGDASAGEEAGYSKRVLALKEKLKPQLATLKIAASANPPPNRTGNSDPLPTTNAAVSEPQDEAEKTVAAAAPKSSAPSWDVYKSTRSSSLVIFGE